MGKGKLLTTVTLTFYEDRVEFTGMEPWKFKTQEDFIEAINLLLGFCRGVLEKPATMIPGFKILGIAKELGEESLKVSGGLGVVVPVDRETEEFKEFPKLLKVIIEP